MAHSTQFSSHAWLLRGISASGLGKLSLKHGRLSLKVRGCGQMWPFQLRKLETVSGIVGLATALENGEWGTVFEVPVRDVVVHFPWYTFSGGINVVVVGVKYRMGFTPPRDTHGRNHAGLRGDLGTMLDLRKNGRRWREIFAEPKDTFFA